MGCCHVTSRGDEQRGGVRGQTPWPTDPRPQLQLDSKRSQTARRHTGQPRRSRLYDARTGMDGIGVTMRTRGPPAGSMRTDSRACSLHNCNCRRLFCLSCARAKDATRRVSFFNGTRLQWPPHACRIITICACCWARAREDTYTLYPLGTWPLSPEFREGNSTQPNKTKQTKKHAPNGSTRKLSVAEPRKIYYTKMSFNVSRRRAFRHLCRRGARERVATSREDRSSVST